MNRGARLVNSDLRSSIQISPEPDATVDNLHEALEKAHRIVGAWLREGLHGETLPTRLLDEAATVYEAIHELDRIMPEIESYVCGYYWGSRPAWSGFSAHGTREDAERWLPHWQEAMPKDAWIIEFRPSRIIDFVHPEADPRERTGQFNRR